MIFDIKRIESGFKWLQNEFDNSGEIQSVDVLIQRLDAINSSLAWSGEQMAISKKLLNEAKVKAYHKLQMSSESQKKYYAPSLAKDYISAQCSNENYNYDMCERFSRALVHISDNLRTAISALKEMSKLESYSQNVP
jgi:hypothetical protein